MLKQGLYQKLQQRLSPKQIQLMKLIQLPSMMFEQKVQEELEINPALEEGTKSDTDSSDPYSDLDEKKTDDLNKEYDEIYDFNVNEYIDQDTTPEYKYYSGNGGGSSEEEDNYRSTITVSKTLHEHMWEQFHTFKLSEEDLTIGEFLIGCIDDEGYIRRPLKNITEDMVFNIGIVTTEKKLEKILVKNIQKLDPLGVGARNLRECLLIQLKQKSLTESTSLSIKIIDKYYEVFIKKHYKKLMARIGITENSLKDAIHEIERLNPKPGKAFSSDNLKLIHIIPDFTIHNINNNLELKLNARNAPKLRISREYNDILSTYKATKLKSKEQKNTALFVKQKLDSAKWFIEAVLQRQNTLMMTMNAILQKQYDYFLTGDEQDLKPMILKDIADQTDLDVSTISRVANSKYVDTPFGTVFIKNLFSEGMATTDGEEVSTIEIKKILSEAIEDENKRKPLTDDALTKILNAKGYKIARRTTAKYREQLNIPVARLRKKLND